MQSKPKTRLEKVLRQVDQWASESWPAFGWLEGYMSGGESLALANSDLQTFGMLEINKSLQAAKAGQLNESIRHMAFGFARMTFAEITNLKIIKGSDRRIVPDLDGVTHLMLGAIATGQPGLAGIFHGVVIEALAGNYGVRDGRKPPIGSTLRYAAFGLSIIGDWLGKPLDLDAHALPRDPAWGQLVAHWREPDPEALLPALLLACDTHVERIAVSSREVDTQSKQFEFGSVFLAVHPTEILAVLRLRDLLGLPNPATIDHPLMQTPYAAITARPGEIADRDDELLERYLATVRQRDPQALPSGM